MAENNCRLCFGKFTQLVELSDDQFADVIDTDQELCVPNPINRKETIFFKYNRTITESYPQVGSVDIHVFEYDRTE